MEREWGETVVSFQREKAKRKKKEHKARNPLSLFTRRNGNLCRYKGGCFYSGVSIATAPMCSFLQTWRVIIMQYLRKTKTDKKMWLPIIIQEETLVWRHEGLYTYAHTHTWTRGHNSWVFSKRNRGEVIEQATQSLFTSIRVHHLNNIFFHLKSSNSLLFLDVFVLNSSFKYFCLEANTGCPNTSSSMMQHCPSYKSKLRQRA